MRTDGTIDMSPFKNSKQDSPSINEVSFVRVEATKTLTKLYEELSEKSKFFLRFVGGYVAFISGYQLFCNG